jgi:uncharacterized protein YbjT (DUF2867 family)
MTSYIGKANDPSERGAEEFMSDPLTILVTGATGKQGGATARSLLARGHNVRILTRNPGSDSSRALAEAGAEVYQGNYGDATTLLKAAKGADGLFAVTTPFEAGPAAEIQQGMVLTDVALEAGVSHLVYTSVAGADQDTGVPHFDSKATVEKYVVASDVPYTIIAPVYFMENVFFPGVLDGIRNGVLAAPMPEDRFLQQVAVADIGAFAAHAFEHRDELLGQRIELAGGELTGKHVAIALAVFRRGPVTFQETPMEVMRGNSEDMALMYEWFNEVGYHVDIDMLRVTYPDIGWHGYIDWLAELDEDVFSPAG